MVDQGLATKFSYSSMGKLIKALPPELKNIIFYYATGADNSTARELGPQRRDVCLVCKDWAEATYKVYRAWTRIHVTFKSGFEYDPVRVCLANSGEMKLQFEMEIKAPKPRGEKKLLRQSMQMQAFIHQYFTLLGPHFKRVRRFGIVCNDPVASDLAMSYLKKMDCSLLERLKIILRPTSEGAVPKHRFQSSLPTLNHLLCGGTMPPTSMEFVAPTIAELQLASNAVTSTLTWPELRHTLSTFSNVKRLMLADVGCSEELGGPQIEFPYLRTLRLVFTYSRVIHVLQMIAAPALRHLALTICNAPDVIWFLSQSSAVLGALTSVDLVWKTHIADEDCLAIVNAFPAAETLDVSRFAPTMRPSLILALSDAACQLPNLRRVVMSWMIEDIDVAHILAQGVHDDCSLTSVESDDAPSSYYTRIWNGTEVVDTREWTERYVGKM
ncbi:hypothetical protein DFH06DRAFT_1313311 [Mycena polygramma]|nr:hypothetical protein DFH06DRAFT_1315010 [Mycena polygramma]KAJ7684936.1 hypothetical protein DFH06DRAFT_1313311 [Mycena polygramma]